MDNNTVLDALKGKFGDVVRGVVEFRGQAIAWIAAERLVEVCTWLRDDPQCAYTYLSDLSAVDRLLIQSEPLPGNPAPDARFVVSLQLLSQAHKHRLWLKVAAPGENPRLPSVTGVWPGANFLEREVYDLMGIAFDGHPDLRRIMMPDDWQGHPLRKDYPEAHEEVQFTHNFERVERRKKYATR